MATAIIGTLKHLPKASILPTLPETGRPNRIYFIPNEDPTEDNRYNEYLWVKDETYPDGHWELVGPTTIDLTDYATKEEVSDLKDSIGEQIKKYLPLSGGTMDKGSNISFPLDSGSTVYNGSGISVGGKASTDILHAAGGTTKIKTLNGESMLGEGNIVIDPSSVPVSLSWYNRTSSQQDATINLTIGDTTVNLFPNIFKLFKAGKVSTSESLSIELTANPGVSGVPQVPTSLCQWSIPLADSNTAGIISSEDKAKLDNLSDPKNLLAYGVEWDSTNSSPVLTRIGNMSLHKSLPIQSALRGCVCQGKRIMYYLDPNDWSKKADGTDSRLDGYDGTVQVEVPEFYLWSETEGTKSRVYVSTQKVVPYAIRIPHMLVDAYRSTVLNEVPEDMGYLSTLQVNSAISVVNTSSYCRGGNNSSSSDTYLESDKFRTNLGKPRTNTSRANFRTYAKNAGKMLLTYEYYKYFANLYLTGFDHWCKEELKCRYYYRYADDIVILGESKAHLRNVLVAIKLYLKHVLKLGVKGNYQIFPVESRGIDFVGYVFRHDYIRVRKGIKNSCRKRIRHSNNLAGILPSYFGWFQHCNAVNLKRTILDEVRKIENK